MILVSYWAGAERRGMLAWREHPGKGPQALGGFDPGEPPPLSGDPHTRDAAGRVTAGYTRYAQCCDLRTVVETDAGSREIFGWPHPDEIPEVSG